MTTPFAEVAFLDVGQGHATVVIAGSDCLVVDCPAGGSGVLNTYLSDAGAQRLNGCFITHRDLDHCGGMRDVLDLYPADELFFNPSHSVPALGEGLPKVRTVLESIYDAIDIAGTPVRGIRRGESGGWGQIHWTVLGPTDRMIHQATMDNKTNRASLVLMLEVADSRFLVTGDIDAPAISELLASGQDLSADVLLAPHHGARISNLAQLIDAVQPAYGVVSVARAAPKHPARETLEEFSRRRGCRVMCTQVNRMCHPKDLADSFCAGSVRFSVAPGTLGVLPSLAVHGSRIDVFDAPICRLAAPTPVGSSSPSQVDGCFPYFGAIDLAVDLEGRYVFLELNPNGQWGLD